MASKINSQTCFAITLFVVLIMVMSSVPACTACNLTPDYYAKTCPQALSTIRKVVRCAIAREIRLAASIIRLHFHDCFVQGCDASVLLPDRPGFVGEQSARQNNNSIRGFETIEEIKLAVEKICPGVVSCADILAVAARDSSVYVNGPTWEVKLGRRDSLNAGSIDEAQSRLPGALDDLPVLIENFKNQSLTVKDMVALSGSHTIGLARCVTFRTRIYNETNIDPGFASIRQRRCPRTVQEGNNTLAPLDLVSPNSFDSYYFKNLIQKKGLLHSDQVLFSGGSTDDLVRTYSQDSATFFKDFAAAMVKMGDIKPLTGTAGQIRKICSAVN